MKSDPIKIPDWIIRALALSLLIAIAIVSYKLDGLINENRIHVSCERNSNG